ncbi:MAG: DMT family transporter [Oculatellaceae cyanobacterium bins.114]|nr:DMT family transporter [Oculatellaceae cyanobacterium bins.114]
MPRGGWEGCFPIKLVLGATLTLGFIVFGQAIAGVVTDHVGWLGLLQHCLNIASLAIVALQLGW